MSHIEEGKPDPAENSDRMPRERDDDSGQFAEQVAPDNIYQWMTPGEPYTAREVGEQFNVKRQHAGRILRDTLAEETDVIRKEHSPRVITYRRPCDSEDTNVSLRFKQACTSCIESE